MKNWFEENLVLIILGYFIAAIVWEVNRRYRISRWPYTEGVLLSAEVGSQYWSSGSSSYEEIQYQYWVDGVEYKGRRLSPNVFRGVSAKGIIEKQIKKIQHLPNGKIKVFYNPNKPRKSFLIR